jgi:hypothetical protein
MKFQIYNAEFGLRNYKKDVTRGLEIAALTKRVTNNSVRYGNWFGVKKGVMESVSKNIFIIAQTLNESTKRIHTPDDREFYF